MKRFWKQGIAVAVFAAFAGCEKVSKLVGIEQEERRAPLYRQAIAAEQAGNLNEAIQLFEKLLIENPNAYSAHFQLATLLQDHAHDYVGAIHHYRVYLSLRPESDKASMPRSDGTNVVSEGDTLVKERIRKAEELLAPQLLTELGDSVESLSQAKLMRENERLGTLIRTLTVEKNTLASEKTAADNEVKALRSETERLRNILEQMKANANSAVAPEARIAVRPDSAETAQDVADRREAVKKLRQEAAAADTSKKATVADTLKEAQKIDENAKAAGEAAKPEAEPVVPEAQKDARATLNALLGRDKKKEAKKPAEMRVYVVQPGDTLFRVAEKFYGDSNQWKKIRDANRTRIDPDGRIRAGQSILVP
jgi:LysM repeat protein